MRAPERRWYWPREDANTEATPPTVTAHTQDRDDIVGTIYGPDDKPLHTVTKPRRPFGYVKDVVTPGSPVEPHREGNE